MKTELGTKIFELQRYFVEMKLPKLSLQEKKTAEIGDCGLFVKLSDCTLCMIFVE